MKRALQQRRALKRCRCLRRSTYPQQNCHVDPKAKKHVCLAVLPKPMQLQTTELLARLAGRLIPGM